MTRYFFHVRKHGNLTLDPEGDEFDTLDLAYEEAVASAREIVAQHVAVGESIADEQFEITTETGKIVKIIPFRSIVNLS